MKRDNKERRPNPRRQMNEGREPRDTTPKPMLSTTGKVNIDLVKRAGERNEVLVRRFGREMLLSGLATEWREKREFIRPMSRRKRREIAVRLERNRRVRRGY
ncbi:hypothetical protein HYZ64_03090 [Candidatus Berkelbacteria bacterium]|nr:hypothetical protein [Candidatus Berkelbacteria bacterium]